MKLDALTSIKKDALDTNALKSVTGGIKRMTPSNRPHDFQGITYSSDRVWEETFHDANTGELKWAHYATTHLNPDPS